MTCLSQLIGKEDIETGGKTSWVPLPTVLGTSLLKQASVNLLQDVCVICVPFDPIPLLGIYVRQGCKDGSVGMRISDKWETWRQCQVKVRHYSMSVNRSYHNHTRE